MTSSRFSPTLNRGICLAQVDAALAEPGTEVTIRLPDGSHTTATVTEHLAHVDPENTRQDTHSEPDPLRPHATPVLRSPVAAPDAPADAALTLTDHSALAKVAVRGGDLDTPLGRADRDEDGNLRARLGPDEWLVIGEPDTAEKLAATLPGAAVDLTHGRALLRLTGDRAADALAAVCGIDLADDATPNGAALRTSVANLVTDILRDDRADVRSYLLGCERSTGQYLFDALLDAGAEVGITPSGDPAPTP